MKQYELNLSMEELEKRTHKDYLTTKKMLDVDAPEYTALEEGDKQALKHLVKAAYILADEGYPVMELLGGFKGWKKRDFDIIETDDADYPN